MTRMNVIFHRKSFIKDRAVLLELRMGSHKPNFGYPSLSTLPINIGLYWRTWFGKLQIYVGEEIYLLSMYLSIIHLFYKF